MNKEKLELEKRSREPYLLSQKRGNHQGEFVYIEKSGQNNGNSGRGVFANVFFKKDDYITFYDGDSCFNENDVEYTIELPNKTYINGIKNTEENRGFGSFLQRGDYRNGPKPNVNLVDVVFCNKMCVVVQANRDIQEGEELLASYGFG